MTKQCKKCGETKAFEFFYKDKTNSKDGRRAVCKICCKSLRINTYWYNRTLENSKWSNLTKQEQNKRRSYMHKHWNKWYYSRKPGVYLVTFKEGTYIGESKHVENRIKFHKYGNSNVNKGNLTFVKYKILEEIVDDSLRLEREKYWINKLKPSLNTLF